MRYLVEHFDITTTQSTQADFDTETHFAVPDALINDPRLSARAKGVWAYIQTLPHGSTVSAATLATVGPDGRDAVVTALRELQVAGWLNVAPPSASTHNLGRHQTLHRLAERDQRWACHLCGISLIDVCQDQDIIVAADGGRVIDPVSTKQLPTIDHLIPRELGGSEVDDNLALACQRCNSMKGAM